MSDTFFNSILTQMVKILISTMWEGKVYFVSDKKYSTFSQNSIYIFLSCIVEKLFLSVVFPFTVPVDPCRGLGS